MNFRPASVTPERNPHELRKTGGVTMVGQKRRISMKVLLEAWRPIMGWGLIFAHVTTRLMLQILSPVCPEVHEDHRDRRPASGW